MKMFRGQGALFRSGTRIGGSGAYELGRDALWRHNNSVRERLGYKVFYLNGL